MSATATYVYAVGRGIPEDAVRHLRGVADTPVRVLAAGTLTAVVGDVDRDEFEARALAEHREDLAWLTTTARAHHSVVDTVGRDHVIAPLSLATVYFSDERGGEVLTSRRGTFDHVLDPPRRPLRVGGQGLRPPGGSGRPGRGRGAPGVGCRVPPAAPSRPCAAPTPRSRRRSRPPTKCTPPSPRSRSTCAGTGCRTPPSPATRTGWCSNGAYLIPSPRRASSPPLAGAFADRAGLRVELTGPWVP